MGGKRNQFVLRYLEKSFWQAVDGHIVLALLAGPGISRFIKQFHPRPGNQGMVRPAGCGYQVVRSLLHNVAAASSTRYGTMWGETNPAVSNNGRRVK